MTSRRVLAALLVLSSWLGEILTAAQDLSVPHRVLELDGNGSYVQLPDDIFKDLTEGTVEAWVYANHWDGIQRFFNFGGYRHDRHDIGMGRPYDLTYGLHFCVNNAEVGGAMSEVLIQTQVPEQRPVTHSYA